MGNTPAAWFGIAALSQSAVLFGGKTTEDPSNPNFWPYASVYNPSDNSFTKIPYYGAAREGAKGTVAGTYAYFAGGGNQTGSLADIDVYDSVANAFLNPPIAMTSPRNSICAVSSTASGSVVDSIFFGGGLTNGQPSASMDFINFNTNKLFVMPYDPLSQPRSLPGCASYTYPNGVGSVVVFAGGATYSSVPEPKPITQTYIPSNAVDIYFINSNCTKACSPGPCPANCHDKSQTLSMAISFAQGATIGSKMVFAGGFVSLSKTFIGNTISNVAAVYDVLAKTWTYTSALSVPRYFANAAAVGGSLQGGASSGLFYVYGPGNSLDVKIVSIDQSSSAVGFASSAVDISDGNGNWWSTNASVARAQVGVIAVGSKVIFAGGVAQDCSSSPCKSVDVKTVDILDVAVALCNGNGQCASSDFASNGASCSCVCNFGWAGPSCSTPYCAPYMLGASGSCSFDGLSDITKAFALIGMILPCLLAVVAIWRTILHFKSNDPMAMRPLKESLLGEGRL